MNFAPAGLITLRDVGKAYKQYPSRWARLAEWLHPASVRHVPHWVLRQFNLQVIPGQAVGIIGRNGAGKSTLLKLIVGTSLPTEGEVNLHGRVAALLELGMGFHPDFSGRQNVWMAAQLLGLTDAEIAAALPHIENFAEIGRYIDEPVRTYSSGMQMRLAFSVATAVRPDILIVDEALSVGDAYFQHKCFARIRSFRSEGTTLLFVSHDPGAIKNLCDRAVLLDAGKMLADDTPDQVLDLYNALIAEKENSSFVVEAPVAKKPQIGVRSGDKRAQIVSVECYNDQGLAQVFRVGEALRLHVRLIKHVALTDLTVGFLLRDRVGNDVYGTNTWHVTAAGLDELPVGQEAVLCWNIPALNVGPGSYTISVALHGNMTHVENSYDWWDKAVLLQIVRGSQSLFEGMCYLAGVQAQLEKDLRKKG